MTKNKNRLSFVIIPMLLVLAFACAFSLRASANEPARAEELVLSGDGTEKSPKQIFTADDFVLFMNTINGAENDSAPCLEYHYKLMADINLSGKTIKSIGSEAIPFKGSFNGNGFVIKNYTIINANHNYVGLFGYLGESASITSVGLVDANVTATFNNVGGIAGMNKGKIEKCFYHGYISGSENVGGIAGENMGEITLSFSNATVAGSGVVGGLVGKNHARLSYSYYLGQIMTTSMDAQNVGTIIGGRYSDKTVATPTGTFFNSSLNEGIQAVGHGNSLDNTTVTLQQNRVRALERNKFNTEPINNLFGSAINVWDREVFVVRDHSSYVGPLQDVFAVRLDDVDLAFTTKMDLESACSERMYGKDLNNTNQWGSENNPFIISTEKELRNLQRAVSEYGENYENKVFSQTSNIVFASKIGEGEDAVEVTSNFNPIGSFAGNNPFQGTYNGNNKTISNLRIEEGAETDYLGLFGYIGESALIKNLSLDEGCWVTGMSGIGSVVGYNYGGKLENVDTSAIVTGQSKCGGLVGITRKGNYVNVLSKATLKLRGKVNNGMYGIIGGYQDYNVESIENAWYFASLDNEFKSTNNYGHALLVDDANGGKIEATREEAKISFNQVEAPSDYSVEYRDGYENVVCANKTYLPESDDSAVVYARFVKSLSITTTIEEGNDLSTYVGRVGFVGSSKFYVGQSISLLVPVLDGGYVSNIEGNVPLNATYNYDGNAYAVVYNTTMVKDLTTIIVNIGVIEWATGDFQSNRVYNGTPVEFPLSKLLEENKLQLPVGYNAQVNYSTGTAPINANASESENYSFTIIYLNKFGIRMGAKNGQIHIAKRQLEVDVSSLVPVKEWDGTTSPTEEIIASEYIGNLVSTEQDVVLKATISNWNADVGTYNSITYTFTISGEDSVNYIAPAEKKGQKGDVIKRKVIINFDSYFGYFDGLGKKPSLSGKNIIVSGAIASYPPTINYVFKNLDGSNVSLDVYGAVGEYRLEAILDNESQKRYEVYFTNDSSYITYTVEPLPREVFFLIDGVEKDSIVFDGNTHTVSAYYLDLNENKIDLILDLTDIDNAGEYVITASCSDTNYNVSTSGTRTITIEKADPKELELLSGLTHDFGTTYTALVEGNGAGNLSYEIVENCSDMGAFEENVLSIYKAGEITFRVTQDESANYNSISKEFTITVNKTEIEVCVLDCTAVYLDEIEFSFTDSDGNLINGVAGVDVYVGGNLYQGETLEVGEYDISIVVNETAVSDGYVLKAGQCGVLKVNKLAITVTADDQEGVYGDEIKALTYTISDSRVEALNGSLATSAKNVGESAITIGDLEEKNPNFDITFVEGTYVITPKALVIKAIAQEKNYGDADPQFKYDLVGLIEGDTEDNIGLNFTISRMDGEDAYKEGTTEYATYGYILVGNATVTTSNYVVSFERATLTIKPQTPSLVNKEEVSIVAGTRLSGDNLPTITVSGKVYVGSEWNEQNLDGTYAWKNEVVPSFKEASTINYPVIFTPSNKNFSSCEIEIAVSVIPQEVSVRFVSPLQITYNGYDHNNVEYELVGLIDGEDANDEIIYSGDYKNVGEFTARVVLNNHNYKLVGNGEVTVEILRANLEVSVKDVTITEGDKVEIEFLYLGFQTGDDEECLLKEPSVKLPTSAGTYTLTPAGAKADNYSISYKSFTLIILTTTLTDEENDLTLDGKFDVDTDFEMLESELSNDVSEKYEEVKVSYKALENMAINKVYDLNYTIDGQTIVVDGEVRLTMLAPTTEGDAKVAYAILTNDGEILYVQDVFYDGDYVTLDVTNAKALLILGEQEDNSMMLYLAIGAGVIVVILIAVIVRAIKKRREARYVKYDD